MLPVLVALAIGFVIGALRRPHGAHIHQAMLTMPVVGVAGAAMQLAGAFDPPMGGQLLGVSLALLAGFALVNRHLAGMGVLAVGLACNLVVVLANGGMPVRATALVESGAVAAPGLADADLGFGRQFEETDDVVVFLGDIIPVDLFGAAMSFGDLIALFGLAAVAGDLARHARRGQKWAITGTPPPNEPILPALDLTRPTDRPD